MGATAHDSGNEAEVCEIQITYDNPKNLELSVELLLEDDKFPSHCKKMTQKFGIFMNKVKGGMHTVNFYFVENNVLFSRSIVDNGHKFEVRVIPESLVDVVYFTWATINQDTKDTRGHMLPIKHVVLLERYEGAQLLRYCKSCKVCAVQKVKKPNLKSKYLSLECNRWNS